MWRLRGRPGPGSSARISWRGWTGNSGAKTRRRTRGGGPPDPTPPEALAPLVAGGAAGVAQRDTELGDAITDRLSGPAGGSLQTLVLQMVERLFRERQALQTPLLHGSPPVRLPARILKHCRGNGKRGAEVSHLRSEGRRDAPNLQRTVVRRPPPDPTRTTLGRPPPAGRLFGGHAASKGTTLLNLPHPYDWEASDGMPFEAVCPSKRRSAGRGLQAFARVSPVGPLDGGALRVGNVSTSGRRKVTPFGAKIPP